jgi:hypothetical protein
MAAYQEFLRAKEQAEKIIGVGKDPSAVVEEPKNDPKPLVTAYGKALMKLNDSLKDFEPAMLEAQDALSKFKNAMKQNATFYQRDSFGIDEKVKENAKKVKDARKVFSDFFAKFQSNADKEEKDLDSIEKAFDQVDKTFSNVFVSGYLT